MKNVKRFLCTQSPEGTYFKELLYLLLVYRILGDYLCVSDFVWPLLKEMTWVLERGPIQYFKERPKNLSYFDKGTMNEMHKIISNFDLRVASS